MARPTTFDYIKAFDLYNSLKTDEEISTALKIPRSTVSSWRQRNKLKVNEVKREDRQQRKPRKTYKSILDADQIEAMESFLSALEGAWGKCKKEGVQMDISRAIETLRHK